METQQNRKNIGGSHMKKIITIDVGNIPPNEVENYMEEMMRHYKGIPYIKKSKIKRWLYDVLDTIGIAGSWRI